MVQTEQGADYILSPAPIDLPRLWEEAATELDLVHLVQVVREINDLAEEKRSVSQASAESSDRKLRSNAASG
jgi:hypothetical protein